MAAAATSPPQVLGLVADPHRWRLLAELARSNRRVGELTELIGQPQNVVSYHLGKLRAAGVVSSRRSSADGRDVYYRADLARCQQLLSAAGGELHPGVRLAATPPAAAPARGGPARRVLFLCTGNSARSQIAEALLAERSGHRIEARSAGSDPKPLHPDAVAVMAERGIDISANAPKRLGRFARMRFDRVVTLCDKVREVCPEFPGPATAVHWSIPDPAAEADPSAFERLAEELETRVGLLIAELSAQPAERSRHVR
jgi:protein-tyrosine-phosphatase/DNA-binding transcriptional ArsR family regulator